MKEKNSSLEGHAEALVTGASHLVKPALATLVFFYKYPLFWAKPLAYLFSSHSKPKMCLATCLFIQRNSASLRVETKFGFRKGQVEV